MKKIAAVLLLFIAASCTQNNNTTLPDPVEVPLAFHTVYDSTRDVDSPAVWHGEQGEHWILLTSKAHHKLWIYDAQNGSPVDTIGSKGSGPGQF